MLNEAQLTYKCSLEVNKPILILHGNHFIKMLTASVKGVCNTSMRSSHNMQLPTENVGVQVEAAVVHYGHEGQCRLPAGHAYSYGGNFCTALLTSDLHSIHTQQATLFVDIQGWAAAVNTPGDGGHEA